MPMLQNTTLPVDSFCLWILNRPIGFQYKVFTHYWAWSAPGSTAWHPICSLLEIEITISLRCKSPQLNKLRKNGRKKKKIRKKNQSTKQRNVGQHPWLGRKRGEGGGGREEHSKGWLEKKLSYFLPPTILADKLTSKVTSIQQMETLSLFIYLY